ncbi:hypothetical protein [Amycolatopsis sp. lyj-23]
MTAALSIARPAVRLAGGHLAVLGVSVGAVEPVVGAYLCVFGTFRGRRPA